LTPDEAGQRPLPIPGDDSITQDARYNLLVTTNQNRLERLQDNLDRILDALKTHYHPDKVIVFGSMASGNVTDSSDLDLLIIKQTDKRFFDRVKEVVSLCDYDVGVDFLVYTPRELSEEMESNFFVRDEIISKGKVVYSAGA